MPSEWPRGRVVSDLPRARVEEPWGGAALPREPLAGAAADRGWWPVVWDAAQGVGACMSTRCGGVSAAPWDGFNLGAAVGDNPAAVRENRRRFEAHIGARPVWLRQVHGSRVLRLDASCLGSGREDEVPEADAAWTNVPGLACTIQVADCLPILLAAPQGRGVAAAHAGWRGLAEGVVEATLQALCDGVGCSAVQLVAWLGPCIGARQFEVGADVLHAFGATPDGPSPDFVPRFAADGSRRWLADLAGLARSRLMRAGVGRIGGGGGCTVEDRARFFSYRRDRITGRQAAAVWIRT